MGGNDHIEFLLERMKRVATHAPGLLEAMETGRELTPKERGALRALDRMRRFGRLLKMIPEGERNPTEALLCRLHDALDAKRAQEMTGGGSDQRPMGLFTADVQHTHRAGYPPEQQAEAIRRIQKRLGLPLPKEGGQRNA